MSNLTQIERFGACEGEGKQAGGLADGGCEEKSDGGDGVTHWVKTVERESDVVVEGL